MRRPIPLPPESLRPEPRVRTSRSPSAEEAPESAPGTRPAPNPPSRGESATGRVRRLRWGPVSIAFAALSIVALAVFLDKEWGGHPRDLAVRPLDPVPGSANARTETAPPEPVPSVDPSLPSRFVLQAASTRTRRRAQEILTEIRSATGISGAILPSEVNGEQWFRVLLGPFADEGEAARAADAVRGTRLVKDVLIRPTPPGWEAARRPEGW